MEIQPGDILKLKKPHPCGSREWQVKRIGSDLKLACLGCGHLMMIARFKVEKNIVAIRKQTDQTQAEARKESNRSKRT